MKGIIILAVLNLLYLNYIASKTIFYSDKYDHIDIKKILANQRLRNQYWNCFMREAPCKTADAKFFRGIYIYTSLKNF